MNRIDWISQYKAVIQRIFERGNEAEQNEILRFYGSDKINAALADVDRKANSVLYI